MRRRMTEVNQSLGAAGTQNHTTKVREAAVAVGYSSAAGVCVRDGVGGGGCCFMFTQYLSFLLTVTIPLLLLLIMYTAVSSYVFVRGIAL